MCRYRYIEHVALSHLCLNSLAPGGFENIFQNVFFKLISWIDTLSNSCETALRSMPQNPSDDKSTLVQVMAWCRQAASHYLSQCCPRSLSPYGVTRPQWVKENIHEIYIFYFRSIYSSVCVDGWFSSWLYCLNKIDPDTLCSLHSYFTICYLSNKTLLGSTCSSQPETDSYFAAKYIGS